MNFNSLLKNLQESDERTKRWWLIVLSLVAMGIVLFIWLHYFAALVNTGRENALAPPEQERSSQSVSFWETMRAGVGVIFDRAKGTLSWLGEILQAPRSYIIKP